MAKLKLFRTLLFVATLGVLAVVVLSVALFLERRSDVELPKPTGPDAVGRVIYDWRDSTHEVLAWLWYPAASDSTAAADYLPAQMRGLYTPPGAPIRWVTRDLSKVHAHAVSAARLAGDATYPVVILRGGGSAPVWQYSVLAEDLASYGYVVVGLDVPALTSDVIFPDGRVVQRTQDNDLELYPEEEAPKVAIRLLAIYTTHMSFALDRLARLNAGDPSGQFTGRLDMTRIGAFGHSFGGAQAAQFCHDEARCVAAIDIDGLPFGSVVKEGMPKPFMFLMESPGNLKGEPNPEVKQLLADMRSIYAHVPVETRQCLAIRGANHFTFADDGAVLKSALIGRILRLVGVLKIDGRRQVTVTRYVVRGFFDAHLKQKSRSPLNLLSPSYSELEPLDIQ